MVEKLGRRMTAAEEARFWHELNEQERLKKEDRHRSARPAFTPTPAPSRRSIPPIRTRRMPHAAAPAASPPCTHLGRPVHAPQLPWRAGW